MEKSETQNWIRLSYHKPMRLIRKKSDWWIILAIYGGGAIGTWFIARDPWVLAGASNLASSFVILFGCFFVGAIFYAPVRVLWEWIADRQNRVEYK